MLNIRINARIFSAKQLLNPQCSLIWWTAWNFKIWRNVESIRLQTLCKNPNDSKHLLVSCKSGLCSFLCTYTEFTVIPIISESSQLWKMSQCKIRKGRSVGMQSWDYEGGLFLRESPALNCFQKIINRAIFVKDTLSFSGLYIQLHFQSAFNIVLQQLASCNTHLGKYTRCSSCPVRSLCNRWRSLALAEATVFLHSVHRRDHGAQHRL